jgi:hypothetical protein
MPPKRENVFQTRERAGKSYLDRRRIAKPLGHERPRILRHDSMAFRHPPHVGISADRHDEARQSIPRRGE